MDWGPYLLAIIGVGGTLAGSWLAARSSRQAQREQLAASERIQRATWSRHDAEQFQEERRVAYTQLLDAASQVDDLMTLRGQSNLYDLYSRRRADLDAAYNRIELLAGESDVVSAAWRVRAACSHLANRALRTSASVDISADAGYLEEANYLLTARDKFIKAARADLGRPAKAVTAADDSSATPGTGAP